MVPGKQPVRGLPRPAPDCGHYATPSTPFRHQHPEDSDMDSEIAQGTRAPSPASPVDAGTIASPQSETVEACDCAQPPDAGRSTSKKRLLAKSDSMLSVWKPALTLENSGSVARDHLASERTFLAYVRTSLTIASTGVALVQLFTISAATTNKAMERYARPVGAVVICVGLATLLLGFVRYFTIQAALIGGNFPAARVSPIMMCLVMSAVIVVVFGIIVGVR